MIPVLLVAIGGACGSAARYLIVSLVDGRFQAAFPAGTFAVNVIGSFLIGGIAAMTDHKGLQLLLMVGVMGGYTTFSSFSLQSVRLIEHGRWGLAALYILGSVACCLAGTVAGQALGHLVRPPTPV